MKLKTVYFAGIVAICLLAFIGCNSTVNEGVDFASLNGEFHFIGYRCYGEWIPKEGNYDTIITFDGTNYAKEKRISDLSIDPPDLFALEFDYSNRKYRFQFQYITNLISEYYWSAWVNYNFNNDVLGLKLTLDPDDDFYLIYQKL